MRLPLGLPGREVRGVPVSYELPPSEADLAAVTTFVQQLVDRGLMKATSVEVETIQRLMRGHRVHQRNTAERLAYLRETGIGYFTDEILCAAKLLAETFVGDERRAALREARLHLGSHEHDVPKHVRLAGTCDRGDLLARVVLGEREALDFVAAADARSDR